MKNTKQTILALVLGLVSLFAVSNLRAQDASSSSTIYQNEDNLYVVVQRSDMCTVCSDNYDRWNKEVVNYYSGRPSIVFMNYDITNDKTVEESRSDIDKYGLYDVLNVNKRPGRVFLINPDTKQIVKMFDIDATTTDARNYINEAAPMKKTAKGIK